MPGIYIHELDSLDELLGIDIDVNVHGMFDNPIGVITNVNAPDTDLELGDEGYPYGDVEIEVEDHLQDRSWTYSGTDPLSHAIVGNTYTLHYGEEHQKDGTWQRITDFYTMEGRARDYLDNANTDRPTRFMTKTYEVGLEETDKVPIRLTEDGIDCSLLGRNTLEETLATVSVDQRIRINIDAEHTFDASVTDISPHELDTDAESSSRADGTLIPDNYEITATDVMDGTITITYDADHGIATVTRTPTTDRNPDYPDRFDASDDPGELSGELHGINPTGNPVEHYNIPWLNKLEDRINTSELIDALDPSRFGLVVAHAYTDCNDRFELYHATVKNSFTGPNSKPINTIVTVDQFNTYGRSES